MREFIGHLIGLLILISLGLLFGWAFTALCLWQANPALWEEGHRTFALLMGFVSLVCYRRWGHLL